MSDDDKNTLVACCLTFLLTCFLTLVLTWRAWENDAARLGHAEFYIRNSDFSRQWRWRTNECTVRIEQATTTVRTNRP